MPQAALLANRNHMNLLELPLLFDVACLLGFAAFAASSAVLAALWLVLGRAVLAG